MGFGNVISQVILFMSVLLAVVMLTMVHKGYISTTDQSFESQNKELFRKFDTSFEITDADYDAGESRISLQVENTGSVKLDPEQVDIFIDDERIKRDSSAKEIEIKDNLVNDNHWDSGEKIEINVSRELTSGKHLIRVSSENGIVRASTIGV
ncbi:MAG: hypothetical protein ACQEP1_05800 [Nanobdellota archaeon]